MQPLAGMAQVCPDLLVTQLKTEELEAHALTMVHFCGDLSHFNIYNDHPCAWEPSPFTLLLLVVTVVDPTT